MSKSKESNPFSDKLRKLIKGVYSENSEFARRSFELLINYFEVGLATDEEIDFLVLTNNNYIVKLLYDLSSEPEAYKLLRSTVGKVVADAVFQAWENIVPISSDEDFIDITGEIFQFDEEL